MRTRSPGTIEVMASSLSPPPVQIRCKGILFDMDGILISSIASVERSWTKWANLRGVDPDYACKIAHGRRAIETIAMLRPDLDSEAELKVIEDIEVADGEGLTVLPGVLELLAALPEGSWTVVTSATERLAWARMADAGIPVPERIVTAELCDPRQTAPRAVSCRSAAAGGRAARLRGL